MKKNRQSPNVVTYQFLTRKSYPQSKQHLMSYLGKGWIAAESKSAEKKNVSKHLINDHRLEGHCVFQNPRIPNKRVVLLQSRAPLLSHSTALLLELTRPKTNNYPSYPSQQKKMASN